MSNERLPIEQLKDKQTGETVKRSANLTEQELAKIRYDIGRRIVHVFGTSNYSEIGRQLGITATTAKLYVDGARFPSEKVLLKLQDQGISIDWLFSGQGKMDRNRFETNVIAGEDDKKIRLLAKENRITYEQQLARLVHAGLKFIDGLDDWKN